ncbi:hypothetical protein KGM48_03815 [Patescibacteria group bacterium]|nr:hypothetical protein [Patescibacteria group bacterium]
MRTSASLVSALFLGAIAYAIPATAFAASCTLDTINQSCVDYSGNTGTCQLDAESVPYCVADTGGASGTGGLGGTCTPSSSYGSACTLNGATGTCTFDSFGAPICEAGTTAGTGTGGTGTGGTDTGGGCVPRPSNDYCFGVGGSQSGTGSGNSAGNGESGSGIFNKNWINAYKDIIVETINGVFVPILIAVAFIVFLFGVYKYFIQGAADEKSRADGRQFVLWGVIGFVVILSLWGIVNIVKDTLIPSTASGTHPKYPTL